MASRLLRSQPDVVLEVSYLGTHRRPYFVYVDLCAPLVLEAACELPPDLIGYEVFDERNLKRIEKLERRVLGGAAGVFTMSRWLQEFLVSKSIVDTNKVHTVHAGINAGKSATFRKPDSEACRLLFVGNHFQRKGGDLVVEAARELHRHRTVELTVAGPERWPLPGPLPPFVTFVGRISPSEVGELLARADVYVMPSQFEAFGIVFAEALAAGVPCVGRDVCAMGEIVQPGMNGELVPADGTASDVAAAVVRCLDGPHRALVAARRDETRRYFSWDRVADDMLAVMQGVAP